MSLRDRILAARKLPQIAVPVPEWELTVYVRVMTGTERDAYEASVLRDKDTRLENMRAKLVVRCAVDENGNLIFTPDDVEALGGHSWVALNRVSEAAMKVNAMTDASLEELKGNSEPSLGDAPSSASP